MALEKPNDSRGFVHKRLFKAATSFVTSGFNPLAAASGFVTGGARARSAAPSRGRCGPGLVESSKGCVPAPCPGGLIRSVTTGQCGGGKAFALAIKSNLGGAPQSLAIPSIPGSLPCPFPFRIDQNGDCKFFVGDKSGPDDSPVGEAIMGRYGAAYAPGSQIVDRAICLKGDLVADDGLCYPRASLTNKQRAWPRGRRPLLTGGEMRAISIATRAGKRLELAQKRLQKIGLMKKAAPRARKQITSGSTEHHHHN